MSRPRKAPSKYLNNAPAYVLSVYDSGEKDNDRYTVLFGWPLWDEKHPHIIPALGFNDVPTSPNLGISQWCEIKAYGGRDGLGKLIAWESLPEALQKRVVARANEGDEINVKRLVKTDSPDGTKTVWIMENEDVVGYLGPLFDTKKEALTYADEKLVLLVD